MRSSKSVALINVLTYAILAPAAIWVGPHMLPEHTTAYYFALNGAGIALMNFFFLTEK